MCIRPKGSKDRCCYTGWGSSFLQLVESLYYYHTTFMWNLLERLSRHVTCLNHASLGCPDRDSTFDAGRKHPPGSLGAVVLIRCSALTNSSKIFSAEGQNLVRVRCLPDFRFWDTWRGDGHCPAFPKPTDRIR